MISLDALKNNFCKEQVSLNKNMIKKNTDTQLPQN